MPTVDEVVQQKRLRLRQIEAQYLRTKEYLKSSDWSEQRDKVLMRLEHALRSYKLGQDGVAAAFVIGQCKQVLLEVQEITDVIVEFEALRDELNRYDERNK